MMRGQGFKRYSDYKNAGLPWLEKIPAHWKVTRLKNLFREVDRRSETGAETLMSLSRDRGLIPQSEMTDRPPRAETLEGYKICRPGEIVMNRMQAWNGMFGLAMQEGLVSPDYTVLKLIVALDLEYYVRLFKMSQMIEMFSLASRGLGTGFFRLYTPEFYNIRVPVPSSDEQRSIVHFINQKLAQIDQFICYKCRLIELLNEQKKAIVDRAVTKGIDHAVPITPSGVEWLGEIPAHWEVHRLKRLVNSIVELTQTKDDSEIYVALEHIESWTGQLKKLDEEIVFESTVKRFQAKDVLFGKLRPYLAKANLAQDTGVCVSELLVLRVRKNSLLPNFLLLRLLSKSFIDIVNSSTYGAKMPRASWDFIGNLELAIPPKEEQLRILHYIESENAKIELAIAQAETEIELIQEYRTTLISDAVTGKIDVRDRIETATPVLHEEMSHANGYV